MKNLLTIALTAISFMALSQNPKGIANNYLQTKGIDNNINIINNVKAPTDTIWYEGFSDSTSVMTNFTFYDSTSQGFNWMWVDAGLTGAPYTSAGEMTIASPTGSNGYMLLPGDWYNSDHNGNMISQIEMKAWFKTPAINCTGRSSVIVRLYEKFRYCCSSSTIYILLQVSTDGTTWTNFDIRNGSLVNTATANPLMLEYNISAIAANQPTVYLRICFGGASHYYMCVDDILLYEGYDYDMRIDRTLKIYPPVEEFPFYKIPRRILNCSSLNRILFSGQIYNMGSNNDNPTLRTRLRNTSMANAIQFDETGQSLTSGSTFMTPGQLDTIYLDTSFSASYNGIYRIISEINSTDTNGNLLNNIDSSLTIDVNDTTLTLWNTASTTKGISVSQYRSPVMDVDGDFLSQYVNLQCDDTLKSISFYPLRKINYMSDMPITCYAVVYQWISNTWVLFDESLPMDFTSTTQFNKWQTIAFIQPVFLPAGRYLFGISSYGGILFTSCDYVTFRTPKINFIYLADAANYYTISEGIFALKFNFPTTPLILPVFNINTMYCLNETPDVLPNVSNNGITGTWYPATINTSCTGSTVYTFTPTAGQNAQTTNVTIMVGIINSEKICIVTVDTAIWKNKIMWEKSSNAATAGYNIYKEVSASIYNQIGYVLYNDEAVFVDTSSQPEVSADRYKITVVDTCGAESVMSKYHKTMYLTIAANGSTMELNWSYYIDENGTFVPSLYNIYRGTSPSNMTLLASVPGTFNSYNDVNIFDIYYYMVGVEKASGCNTAKTPAYSFSNITDNSSLVGINSTNFMTGTIKISPNPVSNTATLTIPNFNIANGQWLKANGQLVIMDITGKVIKSISPSHMQIVEFTPQAGSSAAPRNCEQIKIERGDLKPGVYFVELKADRMYRGKLIIE